MKILDRLQIREADSYTIKNEPIASIDLMERASERFTEKFCSRYNPEKPVYIFCGKGNNGGDGLVVSRLLTEKGYQVSVVVVHYSINGSEDFILNLERLKQITNSGIVDVKDENDVPMIPDGSIVIDALWGTGLTRPIVGFAGKVISQLNDLDVIRVALDVPSGLFCDSLNQDDVIFKAHYTISFQSPKYSFFMPENQRYVGEWEVLDIGLMKEFIESLETKWYYVIPDRIREIRKVRSKFDHKGIFGHALVMAGSRGKIGAAILCARACLKTGAGLVTAYVPECGYIPVQSAIPEVMTLTDRSGEVITTIPDLDGFSTIGIGPGIGTEQKTIVAFKKLLEKVRFPIVIDADGINILSKNKTIIDHLPENCIITPHIGEFDRLTGKSTDHYSRIEKAVKLATEKKIIIVLKGANTAIINPDGRVFFNSTGNPGMATAGSGDVLTGVITSLLAQRYQPLQAAIFGVYLHGLSGDLAIHSKAPETLIASDLIDFLDQAFLNI